VANRRAEVQSVVVELAMATRGPLMVEVVLIVEAATVNTFEE
jgi:hypothetical protein